MSPRSQSPKLLSRQLSAGIAALVLLLVPVVRESPAESAVVRHGEASHQQSHMVSMAKTAFAVPTGTFSSPTVNLGVVKGTTLTVSFTSGSTVKGVTYRWTVNGKLNPSSSKVSPLTIKKVVGNSTYSVQVSATYQGVTKSSVVEPIHLQIAICPVKTGKILVGTYLDLTRMNLTGCQSEHVGYATDFTGSNLANANFTNSHFTAPNFSNANLSGTNFSPSLIQSGNFVRTNLQHANLANAGCDSCVFVDADLSGADLSNGSFRDGAFTNCHMEGVKIANTLLNRTFFTGNYASNLTGTPIGLTGAVLIKGYIVGRGAHLHGADLGAQFLVSVSLTGADLSNANLAGSDISGTVVDGADFTGANLSDVNLSNSSVAGAVFAGATLTGIISGSLSGVPSSLPSSWTLNTGYFIGPGANLSHAVLTGANLQGVNLSGANLTGVLSGGVTGTPVSLPQHWAIKGGYLVGPGAALLYAQLDGMDFSGLDLTGATFEESSLVGAKFDGATADGAIFRLCNLRSASFVSTSLVGAVLDRAQMNAADFSGANLENSRFNNANVTGAKFAGASLNGVTAAVLTGSPASLPTGWTVTGGQLTHSA